MADPRVIAVPRVIVDILESLSRAVRSPVMLGGGWAVHCRLLMANARARPTEDIDVALGKDLRPARAALEAINAFQDDPKHRARLSGFPLIVDLLADDADEAMKLEPSLVKDADGLQMMVPPFADLLAIDADLVTLYADEATTEVLLPRAGAMFASKLGCLYLEFREPEKKASDGLDALALLEAYGPAEIAKDLEHAPAERRRFLAERLETVGFSGLAAQARVAGGDPYPEGAIAIDELGRLLRA
jgi:hypothetical protein